MVNLCRLLFVFTLLLSSSYARAQATEPVKLHDVVCGYGWESCSVETPVAATVQNKNETKTETLTPADESKQKTEVAAQVSKNTVWKKQLDEKVSKSIPFCLSDIVLSDPHLKSQGLEIIAKYSDLKWNDATSCATPVVVSQDATNKKVATVVAEPVLTSQQTAKKVNCATEPDQSNNCSCLATALIRHYPEWSENFNCLDKGGKFYLTDVMAGWMELSRTDTKLKVTLDRFVARNCEAGNQKYTYTGRAPKGSLQASCTLKTPKGGESTLGNSLNSGIKLPSFQLTGAPAPSKDKTPEEKRALAREVQGCIQSAQGRSVATLNEILAHPYKFIADWKDHVCVASFKNKMNQSELDAPYCIVKVFESQFNGQLDRKPKKYDAYTGSEVPTSKCK